MIGKISSGKGFGGTIEYVMGPGDPPGKADRATVLYHTMSSDNPQHWAAEMYEHAQALNPDLVASGRSDLVIHVSLSAARGEHLTDDQWRAVAEEYLKGMGWAGHDYAVIRHDDRPHDHVHLIINRVGQDGETADLHNDYQRQAKVLEAIEKQFGLEQSHAIMRATAEANPGKAVESLTESHLTFTGRDVERYFTRLGFSDEKAKELTGKALGADNVLGMADGRYTTAEVKKEVKDLDDRFKELAGRTHGPLALPAPSVNSGRKLSADQEKARGAIAAGQDLTVIRGIAGTGKTTLLKQSKADLELSGYNLVGASPASKAARGLESETGIKSSTMASLLGKLEYGSAKFDSKTVLIIDEAGMARLDDTSRLAKAVQDAGGRLILLGDEGQLKAVGHSGTMSLAAQHAGETTLDTVFRQKEQWQRDATKAFGEGRVGEALTAYAAHGDITWSASAGSSIRDMVKDYGAAIDKGWRPDQMLAMAYKNEHVDKLNQGIRDALKDRGQLQGGRVYDLRQGGGKGDIELAAGDRVTFTKNPPKSAGISNEDLQNGMFGTVVHAYDNAIRIQFDKGSVMDLDPSKYGYITYGYAATVHKSQGATIDKTFELASRGMDSHLTYTAMSRHRDETTLYANNVDYKGLDDLIEQLSKSAPLEKFNEILKATLEQKLANAYSMNKEQIERYLEKHPEIVYRLQEMGIMPSWQSAYMQDTGNVVLRYFENAEALFASYDKIMQAHMSPGEFKDTRGLFEKLGDELMWRMFGPKTPLEYAMYRISQELQFAAKFSMSFAFDLGVLTTKTAFSLAGVAIKHGVPAIADGLKKLVEAISKENERIKLGEPLSDKSGVPMVPEVNSRGWTQDEQRYIEKWEALQPPNWKEVQKYLDSIRDYYSMIDGRGSIDEPWKGNDKDQSKDAGAKPGDQKQQDAKPGSAPGKDNDQGKSGEDARPGNGQQHEGKDGGTKPSQGKPGEQKSQPTKPGSEKPGTDKPGQNKPGQDKPGSDQQHEGKGAGAPGAANTGDNAPGKRNDQDKGGQRPGQEPGRGTSTEASPGPQQKGDLAPGKRSEGGQSASRPSGSPSQGNTGDKKQEQAKPGTAADHDTSPGKGGGQSSDKGAEAGPSSSTAGPRAGGTNESEKGQDAGPTSSKPAVTHGQSAGGAKGSEHGSSPAQSAGPSSGSTAGRGAESASGKGASQGAGSSSGRGNGQGASSDKGQSAGPSSGSSTGQSGSTSGQGSSSTKDSSQSHSSSAGHHEGSGQSASTRPGQQKPTQGKPGQERPGSQKPNQQKPTQQKPEPTKSDKGQSNGTKPANGQTNSNSSSKNDGYGLERYR